MPWMIVKDEDNFCVHKQKPDGTAGEKLKCYPTKAKAQSYMNALYANMPANERKAETMNPLVKLFTAITEVINNHTRERAVTAGDIWHFVQDQLDVAAVVTAGSVNDAMNMPRAYVLDVYVSDSEIFVLITKGDGRLYKAPVIVGADNQITVGEYQEVTLEPMPVENRTLQIKRMADGKVRWFAFPACTAVLNRVGEIDSTALFDSFIEHIEKNGVYPELDFYHAGESLTLGRADWVGRDGVAYCASGEFYDTPIAQAAIRSLEKEKDYWGLSIAYLPTQKPEIIRASDGIEIPVFNVGVNRFISLLPQNAAASIMTSIKLEGVNRMNDKMKAALKKLTGEDEALFSELELKLDTVLRQAEGMISREQTPPDAEPPAPVTTLTEEQITAIVEKVLAAKAALPEPVEAVLTVTPDPAVTELRDMLRSLTEKVDELTKNREAEIQEVLDDLPAKIARQKIIRPRMMGSLTPDNVNTKERVDMSAIAAETLAKMEQS